MGLWVQISGTWLICQAKDNLYRQTLSFLEPEILFCLTRFVSHLLKHREAFVGLVDGLLQPLLPLLLLQLLLGLLRLLRGHGGLLFFLLPQQLVASFVGVSLEKSDKSSSSINWAAVEAQQ